MASIAMKSMGSVNNTVRLERTRQALDRLAFAVAGDPSLVSSGGRTDFGYVGDVGALPPDLDALVGNPGGYGTWDGPYLSDDFSTDGSSSRYGQDAWGDDYVYAGGVTIVSTAGGTGNLTRNIAPSAEALLDNKVSAVVVDLDFTPPGAIYKDSVTFAITYPDGSGSTSTATESPTADGFVQFGSIPIGQHTLRLVYEPDNDTISRIVSISPGDDYYAEIQYHSDIWTVAPAGGGGGGGGGSGIVYVAGSAEDGGAKHDHMSFDITNSSGSPVTVSSIVPVYSTSPASFFSEFWWDGAKVWNDNSDQKGTGETVSFDSQTLAAGDTITVELKKFREPRNGNTKFDIRDTEFTITFSNGDVITFTVPAS
jgi:hypothetical protein